MRALFGVVGLLVVVAIVGLLATRQMHSVAPVPVIAGAAPASGASVREQAQQTERQVADDVAKALAQGAATRRDAEAAAEGASQP